MTAAANVRSLAVGIVCLMGLTIPAQAGTRHTGHATHATHANAAAHRPRLAHSARFDFGPVGRFAQSLGFTNHRVGHSGGGIQCVTFARADSGIELAGNASSWWANAAGLYQRGNRPEPGSVLNFRANGSMRLGHVAVVNHMVNSRTLVIDHANWGGPGAVRGGISREVPVVDVSPNNDWTAVRVGLGHSGDYGSIYPTFGFIYNRPDAGVMVAANPTGAMVPAMNPAPRDLRGRDAVVEVAEAPETDARADGFSGFYRSPKVRHGYYGSARGSRYQLSQHHRGPDLWFAAPGRATMRSVALRSSSLTGVGRPHFATRRGDDGVRVGGSARTTRAHHRRA